MRDELFVRNRPVADPDWKWRVLAVVTADRESSLREIFLWLDENCPEWMINQRPYGSMDRWHGSYEKQHDFYRAWIEADDLSCAHIAFVDEKHLVLAMMRWPHVQQIKWD